MFDLKPNNGKESYASAIMRTLREPLLVLDSDLHVQLAFRSFYETFKSTPEQTVGKAFYDLGNGQWNIPVLRKLLGDLSPPDDAFDNYQVEHDFPDIGRRTMLLNARWFHNGDPNAKLILLGIEDVTARRQAELGVGVDQRTWFQTALASIGDAVIATDARTMITYLNSTAETATGWTQKEAVGRQLQEIFNIVDERTREKIESPVARAIRQNAIVGRANHTLLIARDGTERPIDDSAAPIRDAGGGITGVVMVFRDITARGQAEQTLEASEIRYRRLFEAAHDGILILSNITRKITDVNPFMMALLDFPREYFIGKELWEIGIFRDKHANQSAMAELQEKGSVRFEDLPLQDRNGNRHPVEIVANIYQEDREPVIQCNIRDIAERVQFEREREALLANEQAARMEAEAANRSKDLFLATLSHEVRTPLNAIMGWATILRDGKCDEADLREGMEVIERNCKAQAQIIEDVLDISRIVSGKLQLQIGPCELVDVIKAAIDVVRPTADAKGIIIETTLDPEASHVSCDASRMQQVVWNLLTNAVKFTPRGKTIRIRLARERSTARIQVSDEGQGISAQFLPYVFDRFRQADSSTRRKLGGLGLGLSIVKHVVEVHCGTVRAESAGEGRGTTFTINLPIRAVRICEEGSESAAESSRIPTLDLTPVRLDGLRVLVVDDEADARRLLARVLSEEGAVVTSVGSVAEAMEILPTANPQVLVSDIAMPDNDGYDLIRQVRGKGLTAKDLPAVALTAFAHKDDRLRALRAGFQVHVSKPVDPHDLNAVIASLSGRTA